MGANKDEEMFFIFYYMVDLFPKEEMSLSIEMTLNVQLQN